MPGLGINAATAKSATRDSGSHSGGDSEENLITLFERCHGLVHDSLLRSRSLKLPPSPLGDAPWDPPPGSATARAPALLAHGLGY